VKESTGRVAASARSARRTETAAFALPAESGAADEEGGRKEVDEEERKGEEDEESERRRGEATAAPGIVPALLRWGRERRGRWLCRRSCRFYLFIHPSGHAPKATSPQRRVAHWPLSVKLSYLVAPSD
jgi:hypothetical protein